MKHTHWAMGILIAAIGSSGQAGAAVQTHVPTQGAVSNCQAALPSFEGAFRKRPLGIANVGGSTAFISCAVSVQTVHTPGIEILSAAFINRGATSVDVSCTLINGLASPLGMPTFFPKVFTVAAGQAGSGTWSHIDNGAVPFIAPSFSCAIPPGVEINVTQTVYDINIGA